MSDLKLKSYHGFTLVELIVVIVILAILATIAFLSFSSQSSAARDSARLSDITNISKGLSLFNSISGNIPMPEGKMDIFSSGSLIGYQGYAGVNILNIIKLSGGGKDPLDNTTYYTYSTNSSRTRFQILGFLEDGSNSALSFTPDFARSEHNQVSADPVSYSGRHVFTKGDTLGILLSSGTSIPLQATDASVDLSNMNSGTVYRTIFGNENSGKNLLSIGAVAYSHIYNRRAEMIKDKNFLLGDDNLAAYWDMSTFSGGKVKDMKNGNDADCYDNSMIVSCPTTTGGPLSASGNASNGNSMYFDGIDDMLNVGTPPSLNITEKVSVMGWINTSMSSSKFSNTLIAGNYSQYLLTLGDYSASAPRVTGYVQTTGGWKWIKGDTPINDGLWHFVAMTYDGSHVRVYLDGALDTAPRQANGTLLTPGNFTIGTYGGAATYFFNGKIDEVRVFNRALTDNEVSTIYNSTR